jgi:hypothetical protein
LQGGHRSCDDEGIFHVGVDAVAQAAAEIILVQRCCVTIFGPVVTVMF